MALYTEERHGPASGGDDPGRGRPARGGRRQPSLVFARILGGVGRTMITAGVLILAFVAYQLWGTGIRTAGAQDRLEDELAEALERADSPVVAEPEPVGTTPATNADGEPIRLPPTTAAPLPAEALPQPGEAAGQIVAERIGMDWVYVEGVTVANLKLGPGHYPDTPLPGQAGNAAIAGHRTTYGAPFANIDQLQVGDDITVTTVQGTFTYEVMAQADGSAHQIVAPSAVEVLGDFGDNRLTLTACHPKYSARQRIIVVAELVGEPLEVTTAPRPAPAAFEADLSGQDASNVPAILWGLLCAAIWLAAWGIGRWRRRLRWPAYAVGIVPFAVALFFFFENVSRLLPANY